MASNGEEEPPSLPQPHEWNSMAANLLKSRPLQYLSQPNFNGAALKRISDNHKLAEIALIDPKRVKRILANRESAARSKERKVRYIAELEHKLQALQTETTTLSHRLALLQRDSDELASQNIQLRLRIQAMEQEAQLGDALKVALTMEVHRLQFAAAEPNHVH